MATQFVQRMDSAGKAGKTFTLEEAEGILKTDFSDKFQTFDSADVKKRLQQASDLGTFLPVKIPLPGVSDEPTPNQGTGGIRDEVNQMNQDVGDVIGGAEDGVESSNTILDDLQKNFDDIKEFSDKDLAAIEAAGEKARLAFQPIVEEQQERRRVTLPKQVIRAGEKGGFESTQQAGIAALLGTGKRPGEAFIGAGGELDEARQNLDRNVTLAKTKQQEAIAAAKAAQRAAIDSGKRQDFDVALSLAKLANQFKNQAETLSIQKQNLALNIAKETRAGVTAEFNIIKDIPAGQTINVGGFDFTGIAIQDIDPFFTGSNIISLMKEIPEGETRELTDPNTCETISISGLRSDDPTIKSIQSTNDAGEVTITSYRLNEDGTTEIINQAQAGAIGKTKTKASSITLQLKGEEKQIISDILDSLDQVRGADGKVPPAEYGKQQKRYIRSGLGSANDFKKLFPPEEELSAIDPNSIPFLQTPKDVLKDDDDLESPF